MIVGGRTVNTVRPANITDYQMARGKDQNISNRNQGCSASSEHNSLTTVMPEYPNTPEIKNGLKSHLMMMTEDFKKDINNFLKEIQDNTD